MREFAHSLVIHAPPAAVLDAFFDADALSPALQRVLRDRPEPVEPAPPEPEPQPVEREEIPPPQPEFEPIPQDTPEYVAAYALHLAASKIVLLADAAAAIPDPASVEEASETV